MPEDRRQISDSHAQDEIPRSDIERLAASAGELTEASAEKIFLPRGTGESRFAPPQYYYLASKSGVLPSREAAQDAKH
jgi:hypothetical protein